MDAETIVKRFDSLVSARRTQDNLMQEIAYLVVPFRAEFYKPLSSSAEVQWYRNSIFDSTAPNACTLLASKIHTNLTSPAIRWFELRFRSDELNENNEAKEWLEDSGDRLWQSLQESDFNTEAAEVYLDLVSFGTSVVMAEENNDLEWEGMDFTAMPIMDTHFEMGGDKKPSRIYRKIRYTHLQLEERFGIEPDEPVGDGESSVDRKHDVIFCVYHRDRDMEVKGPLPPERRPCGYKYILKEDQRELEEGGYYQYPGMVVRWQKAAGSDWGFSPSMVMLSDIKQLNEVVAQTSESRAKAIDPPYFTTSRGVIGDFDFVPGALVDVEDIDQVAPMIPHARFDQAEAEINRLQESVQRGYHIDLLQMKESPQMTATEVRVRYEEIMSMMAPTLGRLQNDFLKPLIEIIFKVMHRKGQLEEMPESIDGEDLDIEFVGPLARAQKGDVATGIEMWLGAIAGMAEVFPQALDIPDVDMAIRLLADLNGVPTKATQDSNTVETIRAQRAAQEEQMRQAQIMQEAGAGLKATGEGAAALKAVE